MPSHHLDLRQSTALSAVRILEQAVLRVRSGHQVIRVDLVLIEVIVAWADELDVPCSAADGEIRLFLLPATYGEHVIHSHIQRAMVVAGLRGRQAEVQLVVA